MQHRSIPAKKYRRESESATKRCSCKPGGERPFSPVPHITGDEGGGKGLLSKQTTKQIGNGEGDHKRGGYLSVGAERLAPHLRSSSSTRELIVLWLTALALRKIRRLVHRGRYSRSMISPIHVLMACI